MKEKLLALYEHKYKWLMAFSLALLFLALLEVSLQFALTGDFVHKGISLKGGSTITLHNPPALAPEELAAYLKEKFPRADIDVRALLSMGQVTGLAVDSDAQAPEEIALLTRALNEKLNLTPADYSVEVMGAALGQSFFKQAVLALLLSFLLMALVVLVYFRILIPSLAIILGAFSDIMVTLAIFNLTGMKLTTGGVAAFLMLIGYSIDTDILLTTRVLKRKEGTVMERVYSSVKTGLTMTGTTIAAVLVGLLVVESETVQQIMIIILIGLVVDIIMTWIQNVGLLRLYLERKEKAKS